jgi:hypothetical protein
MQWPRDADIYRGPLLLVKLGLGQRGLEAALSEEDVIYSQRYYGLQIPPESEIWRTCLNGILNSSLATYFLFLTSSEWGVERDNIPWNDIRRLPVPSPVNQGEKEARRLARVVNELCRAAHLQTVLPTAALARLDDVVFDLYSLDAEQRALVRDMVSSTIDLQRKAELSAEKHPPEHGDLAAYAEAFTGVSNELLGLRNRSKMVAEIFGVPPPAPVRVVKFRVVDRSADEPALRSIPMPGLENLLERIARHLPASRRGLIHVRRHLRVYAPGELYILKPSERRFWTRSAGFHDADAVIVEHLGSL